MIADLPAEVGARRSADAGSKEVSRSMTTETREFLYKVRYRRAEPAGRSLMTTETREFLYKVWHRRVRRHRPFPVRRTHLSLLALGLVLGCVGALCGTVRVQPTNLLRVRIDELATPVLMLLMVGSVALVLCRIGAQRQGSCSHVREPRRLAASMIVVVGFLCQC
jgi:hypothetical protein